MQGPAAYPQPRWETRVRDGVIESRGPDPVACREPEARGHHTDFRLRPRTPAADEPPRRPVGAAAPAGAPRPAHRRGRRPVHGRADPGGAAARREAAAGVPTCCSWRRPRRAAGGRAAVAARGRPAEPVAVRAARLRPAAVLARAAPPRRPLRRAGTSSRRRVAHLDLARARRRRRVPGAAPQLGDRDDDHRRRARRRRARRGAVALRPRQHHRVPLAPARARARVRPRLARRSAATARATRSCW